MVQGFTQTKFLNKISMNKISLEIIKELRSSGLTVVSNDFLVI